MKKSRFTEEQVAAAVKQAESGVPVVEICRRLGVTEVTFYRWKKQFAVTEFRKLRQLEDKNRKLKSLVADLTLDKHMLQEVIAKKL